MIIFGSPCVGLSYGNFLSADSHLAASASPVPFLQGCTPDTPLPVCNCVQCCSILAANPALGLFRFLALIDVISFIIGESLFLVFVFFGLFSYCWVAVQKGPTAGRGSQAGWYEYPEITGSSI